MKGFAIGEVNSNKVDLDKECAHCGAIFYPTLAEAVEAERISLTDTIKRKEESTSASKWRLDQFNKQFPEEGT